MGRTAELGEIAARLGRYAVVTLTGVGGVGKTALAVEAAWIEVSAGRAELSCYADLVPCRTDEQVVAALVDAVGIRGAEAAAGLDAVAEAVSGGRSLLVVDNCEHVLGSARRACDQLAGRVSGLRDGRPGTWVPGAMTRWTRAWPGVMRCCRRMPRWYSGG